MKAEGSMAQRDTFFIGKRFSHHAKHSGYDQFVNHLGSHLQWFDSAMELTEAVAASQVRRLHFLYGDDQYRGNLTDITFDPPVFVTFHQPPTQLLNYGVDDRVLRKVACVIVVGTNQVPYFAALGARNIQVVRHGVDSTFFCPNKSVHLRMPQVVVTVGHWLRDFSLYRGIVERAFITGSLLQFHLIAPLTHLQALKWQPPPNCCFYSNLSDVQLRDHYRRASCLFLPLWDATANNALLEAMACGLPFIISDVGSVHDYASDKAGKFIPHRNVEQWLDEILHITVINDMWFERSRIARSTASDHDWAHFVDSMLLCYRQFS